MKSIIILVSLVLSSTSFAQNSKHHEHDAHEHGAGTLAIAFDGSKGKIEFKAAAEAVLGFEHQARSPKDKKKLAEVVTKFENGIGSFLTFDSSLQCKFTKDLVGQVAEKGEEQSGEHSDWVANYTITCDRSPVGTILLIDFSSFKSIKDIDVTVLIDDIQKSAEFKKKPIRIELK